MRAVRARRPDGADALLAASQVLDGVHDHPGADRHQQDVRGDPDVAVSGRRLADLYHQLPRDLVIGDVRLPAAGRSAISWPVPAACSRRASSPARAGSARSGSTRCRSTCGRRRAAGARRSRRSPRAGRRLDGRCPACRRPACRCRACRCRATSLVGISLVIVSRHCRPHRQHRGKDRDLQEASSCMMRVIVFLLSSSAAELNWCPAQRPEQSVRGRFPRLPRCRW